MCLNYNNNITVASFTGATAMTRVSTSGQCTYLYKVRQTPKDTRTGCQLFQSTYLYKVRHELGIRSKRQTGFNPRTYIRYDRTSFYYTYIQSCFNPRTYIRYDGTVFCVLFLKQEKDCLKSHLYGRTLYRYVD